MYRLFYNYKSVGDVLFVVIEPTIIPDRKISNGRVTSLYKGEKLVGINVFDIQKDIKIKASGMIVTPDRIMIDALNSILVNAGTEKLPYVEDSGYAVAKISKIEEHPLDERMSIVTLDDGKGALSTVTRYQNIEEGGYCVIVRDGTIKFDGSRFEKHVSRNIPIDCELCSGSDLKISDDFKSAFIPEGYNAGDDFFLGGHE